VAPSRRNSFINPLFTTRDWGTKIDRRVPWSTIYSDDIYPNAHKFSVSSREMSTTEQLLIGLLVIAALYGAYTYMKKDEKKT